MCGTANNSSVCFNLGLFLMACMMSTSTWVIYKKATSCQVMQATSWESSPGLLPLILLVHFAMCGAQNGLRRHHLIKDFLNQNPCHSTATHCPHPPPLYLWYWWALAISYLKWQVIQPPIHTTVMLTIKVMLLQLPYCVSTYVCYH